MSSDPLPSDSGASFPDDETGLFYSIDVIAELAGVDTTTVVRYQEQGFLRPVAPEKESADRQTRGPLFDTESLRQLRRIEHLRATCGVNEAGLKLLLGLLAEVEQLREERRRWRK